MSGLFGKAEWNREAKGLILGTVEFRHFPVLSSNSLRLFSDWLVFLEEIRNAAMNTTSAEIDNLFGQLNTSCKHAEVLSRFFPKTFPKLPPSLRSGLNHLMESGVTLYKMHHGSCDNFVATKESAYAKKFPQRFSSVDLKKRTDENVNIRLARELRIPLDEPPTVGFPELVMEHHPRVTLDDGGRLAADMEATSVFETFETSANPVRTPPPIPVTRRRR
jgi:hypothetical protein